MEEIKTTDLEKGGWMEEQLRAYFLDLGYFVIRGAKYKFEGVDVTDVDLWLYQRSTPIARERINVDIKNKVKGAMAIERIIVAKGIKDILGCDRCIVATTDKRDEVIQFGERHDVTVLNGNFLQKIKSLSVDRYPEENFGNILKTEFSKFTTNWFTKLEIAKGRMLQTPDFTGVNEAMQDIEQLLSQVYSQPDKQESLIRLLYVFISHLLIMVDYILMRMAFVDLPVKLKALEDGFRFGTTGETNIRLRIEEIARRLHQPPESVHKSTMAFPADIPRDFFGKNENAKYLFKWARELEALGYGKPLIKPSALPAEIKGILGMLCDCSRVDRKLILGIQ